MRPPRTSAYAAISSWFLPTRICQPVGDRVNHPRRRTKSAGHTRILNGRASLAEGSRHGALRRTNLWEVRKQKLGGYSGGVRQRFGVAVALLGDPKLLSVECRAIVATRSRTRILPLRGRWLLSPAGVS